MNRHPTRARQSQEEPTEHRHVIVREVERDGIGE